MVLMIYIGLKALNIFNILVRELAYQCSKENFFNRKFSWRRDQPDLYWKTYEAGSEFTDCAFYPNRFKSYEQQI